MKTETKGNRLVGISILRIIACFGVFSVHFSHRLSLNGIVKELASFGGYGPHLFFVLSGFLACLTWYNRSDPDSFTKRTGKYYVKRAVRLLPLYYLCILFYFVTETFVWKSVPEDIYGLYWIRYIIPINGLVPSGTEFWRHLGYVGTISTFFCFYLIFPFLNKICDTFKKTAILFGISVIASYLINHFLNGYLSALSDMFFFIMGMIVYHAVRESKQSGFVLLCAVTLLVSFIINKIDSLGVCAVFSMLVYSLYGISITNTHINKLIDTLDRHSYTVYLIHGVVLCGVIDKFNFSRSQTALFGFFGTLLLTILVNAIYEKPIDKLLNGLIHRKSTNKEK